MTTNIQATLTMKSRNEKTGPIPVSTTVSKTCPTSCPFMKNGCYADGGPLAIYWRKLDEGKVGMEWKSFCTQIAALPKGTFWRHNQAGDLPGIGDKIDTAQLEQLTMANAGRRGFTFTHKPVLGNEQNAAAVKAANEAGFTVNVSANNLREADALAELDIAPVVVVLPHDVDGAVTRTLQTPEGRTISVCPATYRDDVNCKSCQLCQRKNRNSIVGFPAHGSARKKASAVAKSA
jgi:hypothetical protein